MRYLMKTRTRVKPADSGKWWIDSDYIKDKIIVADSPKEALDRYAEEENNDFRVSISKNAIAKREPMYINTVDGIKRVGWIVTGKTLFDKGDYSGYVDKYIDLCIEIVALEDAFKEVA